MKILAIESSCDDTAVAIVEDGRKVLASQVMSQDDTHRQFGGIIPEAAARLHSDAVHSCLQKVLEDSRLALNDIDCFTATLGPGLVGSLLIGATTAKTLSLMTGKPFRGVHHLYAHVCSNFLQSDLEPPFLCLLVSGGHTQLIHVKSLSDMTIVGETLDDAVGEAYDKVGRLLEVGFPGGPAIDKLAALGNPKAYPLPIARTKQPYDFSFSGLKTAALRLVEQEKQSLTSDAQWQTVQQNVAASFQATVVKTLFTKTIKCADDLGLNTITIAGGVSANKGIRKQFEEWAENTPDKQLYIPKMGFCTDNAAMIGASAYFNPITDQLDYEVFSRG